MRLKKHIKSESVELDLARQVPDVRAVAKFGFDIRLQEGQVEFRIQGTHL